MAKTTEDYQRELNQLFWEAGQTQYIAKNLRLGIEEQNSKLNTLNQKIENMQKEFRTFLSKHPASVPEGYPETPEAVPSEPKQDPAN